MGTCPVLSCCFLVSHKCFCPCIIVPEHHGTMGAAGWEPLSQIPASLMNIWTDAARSKARTADTHSVNFSFVSARCLVPTEQIFPVTGQRNGGAGHSKQPVTTCGFCDRHVDATQGRDPVLAAVDSAHDVSAHRGCAEGLCLVALASVARHPLSSCALNVLSSSCRIGLLCARRRSPKHTFIYVHHNPASAMRVNQAVELCTCACAQAAGSGAHPTDYLGFYCLGTCQPECHTFQKSYIYVHAKVRKVRPRPDGYQPNHCVAAEAPAVSALEPLDRQLVMLFIAAAPLRN